MSTEMLDNWRAWRWGVATRDQENALGESIINLCGRAFSLSGLPRYIHDDCLANAVAKVMRALTKYDPERATIETWVFNVALNWYRTERHRAKMRAKEMEAAAMGMHQTDALAPEKVEFLNGKMHTLSSYVDQHKRPTQMEFALFSNQPAKQDETDGAWDNAVKQFENSRM